MKKIVLSLTVSIMLVSTFSVTALALGKHGSRNQASTIYNRCNIGDCAAIGPHQHDNVWYCNQTNVDWNSYEACAVEGCAKIGMHKHDDQWYHCANYPTGGGHCRNSFKRNWNDKS